MKLFVLLTLALFASEYKENEEQFGNNSILVKIEENYVKVNKKSQFIGVSYRKENSKWRAYRRNKNGNKLVYNGYFDDEKTAAHASDTLARKLMENGEQKFKLNFPNDQIEVCPEEKLITSKFIGVGYHKNKSKWQVQRWSKSEKKRVYNGYFDDEETAAHASDTLAKKLMENGKEELKLNFPDDQIEVHKKARTSKYFGVTLYNKYRSKWRAQRWNKDECKNVSYGYYDNEKTAAHASDTLARKLMENGEQNHKLNFPDDCTENQNKKRKRPKE